MARAGARARARAGAGARARVSSLSSLQVCHVAQENFLAGLPL